MNYTYFINKILPIIFTINCLYIWIIIVLGTIQLFGYGLLSILICIPSIGINCYVHIKAHLAIQEENEKQS